MKPASPSLSCFRAVTSLAASLGLASCSPGPATPEVPVDVALSPKACLTQEWTPSIRPSPDPPTYHVLAGGTVTSDDFIIGIWLYCDPSLTSTDPFAEDYSEIGQLGYQYEWLYRGQSSDSDPRTSVIINGEVDRDGGSGPGLQSGDAGASSGPVETPSRLVARAVAAGQPVEFIVRIEVGDLVSSASLVVELQPYPEGYRLSDARLSVGSE